METSVVRIAVDNQPVKPTLYVVIERSEVTMWQEVVAGPMNWERARDWCNAHHDPEGGHYAIEAAWKWMETP